MDLTQVGDELANININDLGIPVKDTGTKMPCREWLEAEGLYKFRCTLIKNGEMHRAYQIQQILRNNLQLMKDLGLISESDLRTMSTHRQ